MSLISSNSFRSLQTEPHMEPQQIPTSQNEFDNRKDENYKVMIENVNIQTMIFVERLCDDD